ncbi:myelin-oligodendrocyte glycoprotein-like isoform X1 [Lates japonicus]|uniref:Myelin-oligodendrocyte glycoprotein-like isoform X1 n=1 Tax=Lates japonicus TaxID=270547 RepID=A0AAD3NGQ2_LATJO|nr:myelin-oligodendrocyte glycoprotein-like isoform X1 [Lates japonicus]
MPPHTITLPPPKNVIGAAIIIAFSASSPHFDPTIQLGLVVKGSHGRPPGSPMRLEIGCVQSVLDCLVREPSGISSCKP